MKNPRLLSIPIVILTSAALLGSSCNGGAQTAVDGGIETGGQTTESSEALTAEKSLFSEFVQNAYVFRVFLHDTNEVEEHQNAAITVVQTRASRNTEAMPNEYGLVFLQRNKDGPGSGFGMICPNATRLNKADGSKDNALHCSQDIGPIHESLTVGLLSSEYCEKLSEHSQKGEYVASDTQCQNENTTGAKDWRCVCYDLQHTLVQSDPRSGEIPPSQGSGSGGGRGGGG